MVLFVDITASCQYLIYPRYPLWIYCGCETVHRNHGFGVFSSSQKSMGKHSCFLITSVHVLLAITTHIVIPMLKKLEDVGSSWDVTSQYRNKNTFLIGGQLFLIFLATSHSRFGFYWVLWLILSALQALGY